MIFSQLIYIRLL